MKCPNCGEEIGSAEVCDFCGTAIADSKNGEDVSVEIKLDKMGCPKCGSSNIQFTRENHGEVRGKKSKKIVHTTVGYCKDCGHTWYPGDENSQKKRKTWLWVLGWICIFPLPLTILLLRKKDMKPALKYGIIAAAWIIYLLIGIAGGGTDTNTTTDSTPQTTIEEEAKTDTEKEDAEKTSEETTKKSESNDNGSSKSSSNNEKSTVSDAFVVDYLNSSDEWSGTWESKGDGFFVFYPEGDLAEAFNTLMAYYITTGEIPAELQDSYNSMLDGMKSMSKSIDNFAGKPCSFSIANPKNKDNVLFTIMSGAVIYNAFEE